MKKLYLIFVLVFFAQLISFAQTTVTNLNAFYRDGQVFVTWDNLSTTSVRYNLYKSVTPILYGSQLSSAENLGAVRDSSAKNARLSGIFGTRYFKIDSSGIPLASSKGLFVATSTEEGSFYYALTTTVNNIEDTTIQLGSNSLGNPVEEIVVMPRPVWQETQTVQGKTLEIYTQFVSNLTSEIYPQMTNEGSYAFHFAIYKQGYTLIHPITFHMRPSGASFLNYINGLNIPNEWIVSIDDWMPSGSVGNELASLYYGYHENLDIFTYPNPVPTTGTVYNFTAARVAHTVEWCLKNLPVDTTKVYMRGYSMGAIGIAHNFLMFPEKIAAVLLAAPLFDMSTNPLYFYTDQLWGSSTTNLLTNEGYTVNQRLNSCCMVSVKSNTSIPIMYTFCGKNDENVGWAEKIAFYDSVNLADHGGYHFWSATDHSNIFTHWTPSFPNFSFFTRFKTNLSYPAFSNCSLNDNPGNGTPTNGDLIGSINGYLNWKDDIADSVEYYEITLYIKDLSTTQGTLVAADSGTTDITLRRLQKFSVPVGETIFWENSRNGSIVQQGTFTYDGGLIKVSSVKVYKDSSHLKIFYTPVKVDEQKSQPLQFVLGQNYPNPFNPSTKIIWQSPVSSQQTLKIYDVLGNEVATLADEFKPAGRYEVEFNAASLPSGVYFYQLKAGEYVNTKKMIFLK
ncbi:MAG TPA: T9SS type A sorting domain-containing protein [Ignavibacteriaceae bacterium]